MNSKIKKGLIISLSVFLLLIVAIASAPFLFKDKITTLAKEQINNMLNAKVDFDKVSLSFFRSFPDASVKLQNLSIVGVDAFETDTLLFSKDIELIINLKSLFKDTGYEIQKLQFNDSRVFTHVLADGSANWDIMKADSMDLEPDTVPMSFNLKLKDFVINNADIIYQDDESNMTLTLKKLQHHTSGDLTADSSLLITKTSADMLSFSMDGMEYISQASAEFNADINANLNDMYYKISQNASRINAIAFALDGWVKSTDNGWDMDLTLNAEKVDFKSILSMIPAIYANNFEGLTADGEVNLTGFVRGEMTEEFFPAFDFTLHVKDGWFKYPDLPQSLQQINIATNISNPGKTMDETIIDISRFSFMMANNPFGAQLRISTPMSDPDLSLKANGKLNLGAIKDFYPLEEGTQLNGWLDLNLDLAGKMSYYEQNLYEKFKFGGKMNIKNMLVETKEFPHPVSISNADMVFNNRYVDLSDLSLKIGRNDLQAKGKLENFVAYALKDQTLNGQLSLTSGYLNVSDFMPTETADKATEQQPDEPLTVIEIPKNINFSLSADIKQLVYDKMNFTNAKGALKIADGEMKIQNMGLSAFGGNMLMNGLYSTKDMSKPKVDFDLKIQEVLFTEIFSQVEFLKDIAPIFNKAIGKFSTNVSFNSLLKQDMMPDLLTLIGNGSFSTKSVGLQDVPALDALATALKRSDLSPWSLKDIGIKFDIKDGRLNTQPFAFNVADVNLNLGGSTGLDQSIAYNGTIQMPDKMNLGKLSKVNFKIGGTFTKPKVELDLMSTLGAIVDDKKAAIEAEVTKKVDDTREKAMEEARKQKENALRVANEQADKLRAEAKAAGDKLVAEAEAQGKQMVEKATNPVTKKAAEIAAAKLVEEARKKANDLNKKADEEAKKLIQKADEASMLK